MSVKVQVQLILKICDPFANPWNGERFTRKAVREAVAKQKLRATALLDEKSAWSTQDHIERIAYLVVHGWKKPIDIDVGVPALGCHVRWPVIDGNHRLAAAAVRRDVLIDCEVSGSVSFAKELLQVEV